MAEILAQEQVFQAQILPFFTIRLAEAAAHSPELTRAMLMANGYRGFSDVWEDNKDKVLTACFAGGQANRWNRSLKDETNTWIMQERGIDPNTHVRAFANVRNYMPDVLPGQNYIPMGAYALVPQFYYEPHIMSWSDRRPWGFQTMIVAPGIIEETRQKLLAPLGLNAEEIFFIEQKYHPVLNVETQQVENMPLGHGTALQDMFKNCELRNIMGTHPYWIINGVSDPTSPARYAQLVLAMKTFDTFAPGDLGAIIAEAYYPDRNPKYPSIISEEGHIQAMIQARNGGSLGVDRQNTRSNFGNVGLWGFYGPAVLSLFNTRAKEFDEMYRNHDFTPLNGVRNDFGLDLLVEIIATEARKVRALATALSIEVEHAAKDVSTIPAFERDMREVVEWSGHFFSNIYR